MYYCFHGILEFTNTRFALNIVVKITAKGDENGLQEGSIWNCSANYNLKIIEKYWKTGFFGIGFMIIVFK